MRILSLLLGGCLFTSSIQAQCIQGPSGNCGAETPQENPNVIPAPPIINLGEFPATPIQRTFLFASHLDAEGNYYHMLEGLAIMTLEIQKRLPEFKGFPLSIFLDRQYQDCRQAPGQVYSQDSNFPYMGVCFIFKDQFDAESNYKFGVTTYYQYWDLLQDLIKKESFDCPDMNDGNRVGKTWKPVEGCLGGVGTTFLGDKGDVIPNRAMIYNSDQELIATGTNLNNYDGRYRQCFKGKVGNSWGADPVVIKYFVEGKGEKCFKINNPSQRQD